MPTTPGEHRTVQARILAYAQEIGWTYVPRGEAERRRGFDHTKASPPEQAAGASPFFDDLLDTHVRKFNRQYADGPGALVGDLRRLHAGIAGNREFLSYLRNAKTFYDNTAGREFNLTLIDYDSPAPPNNIYEVTEEYYCHNGRHGTREDVVFLINGIPNAVYIGFTGTPVDKTVYGNDRAETAGQVGQEHVIGESHRTETRVCAARSPLGGSLGRQRPSGHHSQNASEVGQLLERREADI